MTPDPAAVLTPPAIPRPSWLALRVHPGAVAVARRFARDVLSGRSHDAYIVTLLVSELVTNAIRAATRIEATGRAVRLGIAACDRWVHLYVTDPDLDPPAPRPAEPADLSGRGLLIVDALSATPWWTTYGAGAKTVHAVLAAPGVDLTAAELAGIRDAR